MSERAAGEQRGGKREEDQGREAGDQPEQQGQPAGDKQDMRLAEQLARDGGPEIAVAVLVGGAGDEQAGGHRREQRRHLRDQPVADRQDREGRGRAVPADMP